MQRHLLIESQNGRDLIADHFGGMIVAIVHQADAVITGGSVLQAPLSRTDGIAFHANAKDLALCAGVNLFLVKGFGQDLIEGLLIANTGAQTIGGDILKAVTGPDVHNAGLAQLIGQVLGDTNASFAVLHPELTNLFVGRGQGQRIAHGMGEEGRVEVAAQSALLAEINPLLEVLGFQLIPIHPTAILLVEDGIAGVEIHLHLTGDQGDHLVDIGHQFFVCTGPAGRGTGGLDTAGEGLVGIGVKTANIITLPAMQGNRNLLQLFHCGIGVDTQGSIFCFCFQVTH